MYALDKMGMDGLTDGLKRQSITVCTSSVSKLQQHRTVLKEFISFVINSN